MEKIIANLGKFYDGSVGYSDMINMPVGQLLDFQDYAEEINKKTENEMKKAQRK